MPNPLLEPHLLPPFSRIKPEHVEPAIRQLIETNKLRIEELLATDEGLHVGQPSAANRRA